MSSPPPVAALTLPGAFVLARDPGLTAALAAEWGQHGSLPEPVSVTDLVDLRPAFFRRFAPVAPSPDVEARRESGRVAHEEIERLLAPPADREVRLERGGIVSRLDVLGDTPTELKWTADPPADSELLARRPTYFDQLGMYCALSGRTHGRLVVVSGGVGEKPNARVYACEFGSLDRMWESMLHRASLLRTAWQTKDPAGLPRCSWFGHGCEFQQAGRCSCRGDEPTGTDAAHEHLSAWAPDEARSRELLNGIERARQAPPSTPPIAQFREILYPRRTYFERTAPPGSAPPVPSFPLPAPGEPSFSAVRSTVEALPGAWTREVATGGEPEETVPCLDHHPVLVKLSRARRMIADTELAGRQPQYVLELGLRAAAVGATEGRLFLVYGAVPPGDSVRAYTIRFDPVSPWTSELDGRTAALREALRSRDPSKLPGCPRWMAESCPYSAACGGVTGCSAASTDR
ncbi:MAG: hypothetical protein L3K03_01770 [Thermoplasmata archaeon]|nr:hypothetical protein [Thermoplasmata archaeon]